MFHNFLLLYVIFIIPILNINVLLADKKKKEEKFSEAEIAVLKSIRTKHTHERFNIVNKEVKEFDLNEPADRVGKKRRKKTLRDIFKINKNYEGIKIERELKKYSLSTRIWHFVWDRCSRIECYSKNNFALLYEKFLEEMNIYRRIHGSRPLELDGRLNRLAMENAVKSAESGRLISSIKYDVGENSAICSSLHAPLTVYRWYNEKNHHNYKTTAPLATSQHFTNLIWRSALKVGIGIAKKANQLYIFVEFWPPYNLNYNIRENVGKPKYHWYNYRNVFKN
uniref:SCP domain-containing protein n=1 Tax=Strongyloides venezuelensis TaxID=75913 RepID=A0A0K0G210_STRVS